MEKKNIIPQSAKPVVRVSSGTSPQLAELSEEVLSGTAGVTPQAGTGNIFGDVGFCLEFTCSMDDDAE